MTRQLERLQRDSGNVVGSRDDDDGKISEYHSIPFSVNDHFFAFQLRTASPEPERWSGSRLLGGETDIRHTSPRRRLASLVHVA